METLRQDIVYAVRTLLKKPVFTLVVLFTTALAIGANSAIFSVVSAVLFKPLPFHQPDRLVEVWESNAKLNVPRFGASVPNYLDWKTQSTAFESIGAFRYNRYTLTGRGEPERLRGGRVSADFFKMLGVKPLLGRDFLPDEDQPNANPVVILSHALWQRSFGSDPKIVNQTITLDDASYTVVGVMPPDFNFPPKITVSGQTFAPADLWGTLVVQGTQLSRGSHNLHQVVGRLKDGATLEQAQAQMQTIAAQLEQSYPNTNKDWGVTLVPIHEQVTGDVRPALLILLGTVAFVLLIACVNVANLLLARSTSRTREMAIRTALGASSNRLVRQLLTESMLLALVGGALGILLAYLAVNLLLWVGPPESIPRTDEIGIDLRVLGFTLILSLLTGVLFGLAPALQSVKPDLVASLKEGTKGAAAVFGRGRMQGALVITEVALALVLLISAGLLIRSFWHLRETDAGFDKSPALTVQIALPNTRYPDPPKRRAFYEQLVRQVAALPGVSSAGATSHLPLSGDILFLRYTIQGQGADPSQNPDAGVRVVSPDYFKAMGVRLLNGRSLNERDHDKSPPVALINEAMSRRFWPNESPLGKQLTLDDGENIQREIVGVVADVKHTSLDAKAGPEIYLSHLQDPIAAMTLVARGPANPEVLSGPIRGEISKLDSSLAAYNFRTTEQLLSNSLAKNRFNAMLLGLLAALALGLAVVGIYSVMSYIVSQRTREIGIRMAIGAQQSDVLKLVIKQGMLMILIGIVVGLAGALLLTRLMSTLLVGISATDPVSFGIAALALVLVGLLANWIPALRATRVDPLTALRYE
jgi:putative ABC transport system permease protein